MKRRRDVALILGFLFLYSRSVFASGIQAGLVNTADLPAWVCGKKIAVEDRARVSCGTARFHNCSDCDHTVAVMNNSPATIRVNVELEGTGFTNEHAGAFSMSCITNPPGRRGASAFCPDHLAPGEACFEQMQFCPERSGISRGQLKITIEDSGRSQTTSATLAGAAIYNARQQAAEDVRVRHLPELLKLPNVHGVVLDDFDHRLVINVQVNNDRDIAQVRRKVPHRLEGYRTEVTAYVPVGYAL